MTSSPHSSDQTVADKTRQHQAMAAVASGQMVQQSASSHQTQPAPKHDPMKLCALRNRTLHVSIVRLSVCYAQCDASCG